MTREEWMRQEGQVNKKITPYDLLQHVRTPANGWKSDPSYSYSGNSFIKKKDGIEFVIEYKDGDRDSGPSAKLHIRLCPPINSDYSNNDVAPIIDKLKEYGL